jgi:hypothetical protein
MGGPGLSAKSFGLVGMGAMVAGRAGRIFPA